MGLQPPALCSASAAAESRHVWRLRTIFPKAWPPDTAALRKCARGTFFSAGPANIVGGAALARTGTAPLAIRKILGSRGCLSFFSICNVFRKKSLTNSRASYILIKLALGVLRPTEALR